MSMETFKFSERPSVKLLTEYDEIYPGMGQDLFKLWKVEQEHSRIIEDYEKQLKLTNEKTKLYMAKTLVIFMFVVGIEIGLIVGSLI